MNKRKFESGDLIHVNVTGYPSGFFGRVENGSHLGYMRFVVKILNPPDDYDGVDAYWYVNHENISPLTEKEALAVRVKYSGKLL